MSILNHRLGRPCSIYVQVYFDGELKFYFTLLSIGFELFGDIEADDNDDYYSRRCDFTGSV